MIYLKTKQQVILKHRDGISNRQIAKDLGIDKNTVNKYVNEYDQKVRELMERDPTADSSVLIEAILEAPSYDTSSRHRKPSTEEAIEKIRYCLKENEKKRQEGRGKQQMRATDIHNYLTQTCGFEISYSHVKALKRELANKENEAFIRQEYLPGAACEFDWGTVKLDIGRTGYHKYQMAAFASSYGNYRYAVLFRSQDTAAFQEAHVNFFHFCHGIYKTVVYDNMKVADKEFVGPTEREPTDALVELSVYYKFGFRFCNVRRGNEKSHVERTVDVMRHFAFTEPGKDVFATLEEANEHLLKKCIEKNSQQLSDGRVPNDTFTEEKPYLMAELPAMPCFIKRTGCRVDKYSTIVANKVRYSVPEKYTGKKLDVRIYTGKVVVYDGTTPVAEHVRSYKQGSYHLDIFHYLKTLKRKPGALSQSTALLQADTLIKDLYEKHYTNDPKAFLQVLEIINENGVRKICDAIEYLLKTAPSDLSVDKIKVVIYSHNNDNSIQHHDTGRLSLKIKSTLIQYDRLMEEMNCRKEAV